MKLELTGITKRFGSLVANDHIDLTVEPGEIRALLGENGAGKTTLMNVLYGLIQPDEGEILLDDKQVGIHSPRDAIRAKIGMVHQHFMLVPVFTVAENVTLGAEPVRRLATPATNLGGLRVPALGLPSIGLLDRRRARRDVLELSERFGLQVDPDAVVEDLPVGVQQRVEIIKALLRDASVLVLDEPTAVLTPQEADVLFETMREMAAEGRTVIFISHKLHEVKAVADRVTVLRGGHSLATVRTAEATPRSLATLMVGRELGGAGEAQSRTPGDAVLELQGIWTDGDRGEPAVRGASLDARAGEIVAIAGVAGNGQRELAETIAGMRAATQGAVRIGGKRLRGGDPRAAIAAGIAYVPEDRLGTGVAPSLSIASNLVLKSYRGRSASRGPLLRLGRIREHAVELILRYRIAAPGPAAPARLLSGGNLQKVVLAREFSGKPRLLLAASPTRGLDVGAIETVHAYLRDAAAEGVAVLLLSEDLDEILLLADRIAVMYEGAIVGETTRAEASVEELGLLMAGGQDPRAD